MKLKVKDTSGVTHEIELEKLEDVSFVSPGIETPLKSDDVNHVFSVAQLLNFHVEFNEEEDEEGESIQTLTLETGPLTGVLRLE